MPTEELIKRKRRQELTQQGQQTSADILAKQTEETRQAAIAGRQQDFNLMGTGRTTFYRAGQGESPQQPTKTKAELYDKEAAKQTGVLAELFDRTRQQPYDQEKLLRIAKYSAIADGLAQLGQTYFVGKGATARPYDPSGTLSSMGRYRERVERDEEIAYQDSVRQIQHQIDTIDMFRERADKEREREFEAEKMKTKHRFDKYLEGEKQKGRIGLEEERQEGRMELQRLRNQAQGTLQSIRDENRQPNAWERKLLERAHYIELVGDDMRSIDWISEAQAADIFAEIERQVQTGGELASEFAAIQDLYKMFEGEDVDSRVYREAMQRAINKFRGMSPAVDRKIERALMSEEDRRRQDQLDERLEGESTSDYF